MKRVISLVIVLALLIGVMPNSAAAEELQKEEIQEAPEQSPVLIWETYRYRVLADGTVSICSFDGMPEEAGKPFLLEIPAAIDGITVTQIGEKAFAGNAQIEAVLLPETVSVMGSGAFENCANLKVIAFCGEAPAFGDSFGKTSEALETILTLDTCDFTPLRELLEKDLGEKAAERIEFRSFESVAVLEEAFAALWETSAATEQAEAFSDAAVLNEEVTLSGSEQEGGNDEATPGVNGDPAEEEAESEVISSGTCGDNLTWTLNSEGVLSISGSGAMTDYSSTSDIPWYDQRDSVTKIVLSSGVTHIGSWAFYACAAAEVRISDTVSSIGDLAFVYCAKLQTVQIPKSVISIAARAFNGCSSLTAIDVEEGNEAYCSIDGVLYSADQTQLYTYPMMHPDSSFAVPDGVTHIVQQAFADCRTLEYLSIPASVISFGYSVFDGCSKLITVGPAGSGCNMEYHWETTIPSNAFYNSDIQSVTIASTITEIEANAFAWCTDLTDVYYELDEAAWNQISVLSGNSSLTEAAIHLGDGTVLTPEETEEKGEMPNPEPVGTPLEVTEQGDGTAEHPYRIRSAEDFSAICQAPDACYILAADFTISESYDVEFSGVFDGNHHTIMLTGDAAAGLFSVNRGTIMNLNLTVVNLDLTLNSTDTQSLIDNETYNIGCVSARNEGIIRDCTVKGTLYITYDSIGGNIAIGGVAGENSGKIKRCWSALDISVGGPNPEDSYQAGTHTQRLTVGGITGSCYGSVSKCLNSGEISAKFSEDNLLLTSNVWFSFYGGGIAGYADDGIASITSCVQASEEIALIGSFIGYSIIDPSGIKYYMYAGSYYDIKSGFIVGGEYNHGTQASVQTGTFVKNCDVWERSLLSVDLHQMEYYLTFSKSYFPENSSYSTRTCEEIKAWWDSLNRDEPEDHFESKPIQNVRYFRAWDPENQIAYWDLTDYVGSQVWEGTDTSFLENVDALVGQYVLAETQSRTDGMIAPDALNSIVAVDTKTGTVSAADAASITIDDVVYSTPKDMELPDAYVDQFVLYHVCAGDIAGIQILNTEKGTLISWDAGSGELVIDPDGILEGETHYRLSALADEDTKSFLGQTDGTKTAVRFTADRNDLIYHLEPVPTGEGAGDGITEEIVYPDVWSFSNYGGYFDSSFYPYGGLSLRSEGYYINRNDYSKLLNGILTNTERAVIDDLLNVEGVEGILDCYPLCNLRHADWGGSCYGMSSWVVLHNNGIANASDIDGETEKLSDYSFTKEVESAINFYHAQQYLGNSQGAATWFRGLENQTEQLKILEALGQNANRTGEVFLISYSWYSLFNADGTCDTENEDSYGGHAVVGYGWEETGPTEFEDSVVNVSGITFDYRILVYDCADPDQSHGDKNIYYNDEGIWYIPGRHIVSTDNRTADTNQNNGWLQCVTNDKIIINTVDYKTGKCSLNETNISLITSASASYTLKWAEKSAEISGFTVTTDADEDICVLLSDNVTADGKTGSATATALLPGASQYTVTSEADMGFIFRNENYYTMAGMNASGTMTFQEDGMVSITADEATEYFLEFVANDGYSALPWYKVEITGSGTTEVSTERTKDGIRIYSDNLDSVTVIVTDAEGTTEITSQTDGDSLLIAQVDGSLAVFDPELTHYYLENTAAFQWSGDYSSCTMTLMCMFCEEPLSFACEVTTVTTAPPTLTEAGEAVCTATVIIDARTYTETKVITLPATKLDGGVCGEELTWLLTRDGTLTISGTGTMYDWEYDEKTYEPNTPWTQYYEKITNVVIEEGVTSIGSYAFWCHYYQKTVSVPSTLERIGNYAFEGCPITEIRLPEGLKTIGEGSFNWCDFQTVTIPASVVSIGDYAFSECDFLKDVWFAGDAPAIGALAFDGEVLTAHYPAENATWTSDVRKHYGGILKWEPYSPVGPEKGDLNADGYVDEKDAALLLWHTIFPTEYGITGDADFNASGNVDDQDVVYLLWHILFQELFPLN